MNAPVLPDYPLLREQRWIPIAGQLLVEGDVIKIHPHDDTVFTVCGSKAHDSSTAPTDVKPFVLQGHVFYFIQVCRL